MEEKGIKESENKKEDEIKNQVEKEFNDKEDREKEEKINFEIPVVYLFIGGVLLIVFAFAFFAWEDIKITAGVIFGSETAEYKKQCKIGCELQDKETYCCSPKGIYIYGKNEVYTCQDDILKTNCELNCRNVCFNLCKEITQMIPCAEAGCSWILGQGGNGYCTSKQGT